MIDTLHAGIPRGHSYTKAFLGAMSKTDSETQRKMIRRGRDYSQVIDLRYYDVPALLHVANVHDAKASDKFEFIGAGGLGLSEMVGYIREIFLVDVEECDMMRMDTTADLDGAWVPFCRENVRVAGKQFVQGESPTRSLREVSQQCFETIYWGKRNQQHKVYDKTGERRMLLQKIRRQMSREERNAISIDLHFEREYGYSMFTPKTRFEVQWGAKTGAKVLGIEKFGQIRKAAYINPFERWEFPELMRVNNPGRIPRGLDEFSILYLRDLVCRDGLTNARNAMMRAWGRRVFYPRYKLILPLILPEAEAVGPTQEQVRKEYVSSTLKQLAA